MITSAHVKETPLPLAIPQVVLHSQPKQSDCYALGMVIYEVRTIWVCFVLAMAKLVPVRFFVEMLLSGRSGTSLQL